MDITSGAAAFGWLRHRTSVTFQRHSGTLRSPCRTRPTALSAHHATPTQRRSAFTMPLPSNGTQRALRHTHQTALCAHHAAPVQRRSALTTRRLPSGTLRSPPRLPDDGRRMMRAAPPSRRNFPPGAIVVPNSRVCGSTSTAIAAPCPHRVSAIAQRQRLFASSRASHCDRCLHIAPCSLRRGSFTPGLPVHTDVHGTASCRAHTARHAALAAARNPPPNHNARSRSQPLTSPHEGGTRWGNSTAQHTAARPSHLDNNTAIAAGRERHCNCRQTCKTRCPAS